MTRSFFYGKISFSILLFYPRFLGVGPYHTVAGSSDTSVKMSTWTSDLGRSDHDASRCHVSALVIGLLYVIRLGQVLFRVDPFSGSGVSLGRRFRCPWILKSTIVGICVWTRRFWTNADDPDADESDGSIRLP